MARAMAKCPRHGHAFTVVCAWENRTNNMKTGCSRPAFCPIKVQCDVDRNGPRASTHRMNAMSFQTLSVCGYFYPPNPVLVPPALPKPPREAAVARVIGVFPMVEVGRTNCEVFSFAAPWLLEKVLVRAALV